MIESKNETMLENSSALNEKMKALGWGLFFIWIGIAFLANVGWGMGLLGVGVLILTGEVVRKYFGFPLDWFGLITGTAFVVWGVCELLKIQLGLLPVLSVLIGLIIVVAAFRSKPQE